MANVFLYAFRDRNDDTKVNNVFYNEDSYLINYSVTPYDTTQDLSEFEDGQFISYVCRAPYTKVSFTVSYNEPYALVNEIPNSAECGYVAPSCDLAFSSIQHTDETGVDLNNGTISAFASSSYLINIYILYRVTDSGDVAFASRPNGFFTGVQPGTYYVVAKDDGGCVKTSSTVTVLESTATVSRLKYVMEFNDIKEKLNNRVEFYNINGNYEQPIEIEGADSPLIHKTALTDETKECPFATSALTINLVTSELFSVDEFALSEERTWFIKWLQDGELRFQGWLLPDQIQDMYDDLGYTVELVATDGLLSLKGEDFRATNGLQQFGIRSFNQILFWCLDSLGYEYGNITIIKSLQFNNTMNWSNVGLWSDLFYDENGTNDDVYTVLEKILSSFKLCIFQQDGRFILCDWNVVYHANNPVIAGRYNTCFYEYNRNGDLVNSGTNVIQPEQKQVGFKSDIEPLGNQHTLNYDLAFSKVQANIDFKDLVLLFTNPSFERPGIPGNLPDGIVQNGESGGVDQAYATNDDAYIGDFSLRVPGTGNSNGFIETMPAIVIDQVNKAVQLSFNWKVPYYFDDSGLVFSVAVVFFAQDGTAYYLQQSPYRALERGYLPAPLDPDPDKDPYDQSDRVVWEYATTEGEYHSEGELVTLKGSPVKDYIGWQSFSITSPALPSTGQLYVRIYGTKAVYYDDNESLQGNNKRFAGEVYINVPFVPQWYCLYDNFQITITDADTAYNKKIGETHTIVNKTNYGKAEKKIVDFSLFTYIDNKRVAGNVFYGLDYLTADNSELWNDQLQGEELKDKLPAIIVRQVARSYQRPMYLFQGLVQATFIKFLTLFSLRFYENHNFIPYSIELNVKDAEADILICETDDRNFNNEYTYLAKFEKSAKKIVN